ncbi:hypothetical protein I7I48_06300 [Histoplasma ohiense]|nr:hypothetical protein I7I48_06300 [Histoplasma ohiense (nom. inval.)]
MNIWRNVSRYNLASARGKLPQRLFILSTDIYGSRQAINHHQSSEKKKKKKKKKTQGYGWLFACKIEIVLALYWYDFQCQVTVSKLK